MFKSPVCFGATLLFIATNISVITLSLIIMGKTMQPEHAVSLHQSVADELSSDWDIVPYTELTVVTLPEVCP